MHILISPNAFKNALSADEAAVAIQSGLQKSRLKFTSDLFPIADGGDGTAAVLQNKIGGEAVYVTVNDPLGRLIESSFVMLRDGKTAIVEMARASGLHLIRPKEYDPLHSTTFGSGQLIKRALDEGATTIVVAAGGTATVDGGVGLLKALGMRFLDLKGKDINLIPEQLFTVEDIDDTMLDPRLKKCNVVVMCDVLNPMTGETGAAKVFAPQKGASPAEVLILEKGLKKLADILERKFAKDISRLIRGGAAGATSASLAAALDAELLNGIDHFFKLTEFEDALKSADLVITGEGSIDEQTLQGKGPYGVAVLAKKHNKRVIGLAGKIPVQLTDEFASVFNAILNINEGAGDLVNAIKNCRQNLERTALSLGNSLSPKGKRD